MELNDFRCKKCDKLLGKIKGQAEIVCPRCGGINTYNTDTGDKKYKSRLKRQSERTTISGKRFE